MSNSGTGSRYVARSYDEVKARIETEMGFEPIEIPGVGEYVWQRRVVKKGQPTRYAIRIYSSVDRNTGWTRECAEDAIRLFVVDLDNSDEKVGGGPLGGPVRAKKAYRNKHLRRIVHRTSGALDKLRERARDLYGHVQENICPEDGYLMLLREGISKTTGKPYAFYSCSNYPACEGKRWIETSKEAN